MKSKRRHHSSSEESEETGDSVQSSSSGSESGESSAVSEHKYKKKKKHADSSESDSDSENQKRSKKRKHKKKKKKHGKKKRRSHSVESVSDGEISSDSEENIMPKKKRKHKHKHSKRARSSESEIGEKHVQRRLHSVVKERRISSEGDNPPSRTYYQKEYHHSGPANDFEREREVQRFYRGSSKERRQQYQEQYQHDRERHERYAPSHQEKYDRNRENFVPNAQFNNFNEDFRPRDYYEYKRNRGYEEPQEMDHRRQREEIYQTREDARGSGFNRYNQFEVRNKKHNFEHRDYKERLPPPEPDRYREREYPVKKERYQDDRYPQERPRDVRAERSAARNDKPVAHNRGPTMTQNEERYKERNRRPEQEERIRNREERKDGDRPERRDGDRPERRDGDRPERRDGDRPERKDGDRPERRDGDRPEKREGNRPERRVGDRPERRDGDRPGRRDVEDRDRAGAERDRRPPRANDRKTRFADSDEKREFNWGKTEVKKEGTDPGEKEKPNFGLSGKLTEDANMVNGVVIKYSEPDDAKQPKRRWRFYPFKGDKALPILYIHRQSAFLIGRDKKVADIPLEHPSVSKQHAALQYRATPFERADGSIGRRVRPYVIDLDSANGTFVNNKKIEARRYVELLERDVVKFGFSQREYVLLHENSKDDAQDDDQPSPPAAPPTADLIRREKRAKQEVADDGD